MSPCFDLAAQTLVGVANRSPVSTYETNIRGTWTVLDVCRRRSVRRVVVAASDKAYGAQNNLPYTEASPLLPLFPYDVSKAATDMIARSYWHTFGLPVAVTRFANLYGGGDLNLSRLVPECVLAAIDGRPPLIRSDGTPQRDFLYVDDAVEAYLAIWSLLDQGRAAGEAFNAGGGRPHSVREIAELVCWAAGTGVSPDVRGKAAPAAEIERQWVDSTKLREATDWAPRVGTGGRAGSNRPVVPRVPRTPWDPATSLAAERDEITAVRSEAGVVIGVGQARAVVRAQPGNGRQVIDRPLGVAASHTRVRNRHRAQAFVRGAEAIVDQRQVAQLGA